MLCHVSNIEADDLVLYISHIRNAAIPGKGADGFRHAAAEKAGTEKPQCFLMEVVVAHVGICLLDSCDHVTAPDCFELLIEFHWWKRHGLDFACWRRIACTAHSDAQKAPGDYHEGALQLFIQILCGKCPLRGLYLVQDNESGLRIDGPSCKLFEIADYAFGSQIAFEGRACCRLALEVEEHGILEAGSANCLMR